MQISSKLFNQQQLKQFSSTTEELQDLQNKIATGENILRASDDPVGSVELSGLNVVKKQIEQYERNVNSASDRLTLLDKNLENLSSIMVRAQELIIQASSDVLGASDRDAIAIEVEVAPVFPFIFLISITASPFGTAVSITTSAISKSLLLDECLDGVED